MDEDLSTPPRPPLPPPPAASTGRRWVGWVGVAAALAVLVAAAVVLRGRLTAGEPGCVGAEPSARIVSFASRGDQRLRTVTVAVDVRNPMNEAITVEAFLVQVVGSPREKPVGVLTGFGGAVPPGASASFTAEGSAIREDPLYDLAPSEARLPWRPADLTKPCAPYRATKGALGATWPACQPSPGGPPPCPPVGTAPPAPTGTPDPRQRYLAFARDPGPGPVPPFVLVTLRAVTPLAACPHPTGLPPVRGRFLAVTLEVMLAGRSPMEPLSSVHLSITGPDGGRDERVVAETCEPVNFYQRARHADGWTVVIDTRYATGTLTFGHRELQGSA